MDCEIEEKKPCEKKLSAWVIRYHVHDNDYYEGVAVVQAYDVKSAERIFLSDSKFNCSCDCKLHIEVLKEIYCLPEPALLAEVAIKQK